MQPIFGSTFGTKGGFTAFAGSNAANGGANSEAAAGETAGGDAEEECKAEFIPLVQLEEVETSTGEESEECLLELCVYPHGSLYCTLAYK